VLWDESANGEKTRGTPPIERNGRKFCPQCLEEIDDDPGYGLAYGGMGMYWTCFSMRRPEGEEGGCDWFYKVMDSSESAQ
jgi:hypothetical protein